MTGTDNVFGIHVGYVIASEGNSFHQLALQSHINYYQYYQGSCLSFGLVFFCCCCCCFFKLPRFQPQGPRYPWGDSNLLSGLSFLSLCGDVSAIQDRLTVFLKWLCFSDVELSQVRPDQRTLRRFILSRICGSMIPGMAGTVLTEALGGGWGGGSAVHS